MTLKLSKDLADALHASGCGELEVVDPDGNRTYFVVAADIHRHAMEALHLTFFANSSCATSSNSLIN